MFILDTDVQKKHILKSGFVYLLAALFCVLFGAVYEIFSHEVYSYFMIYAFIFPLAGGTFIMYTLVIANVKSLPGRIPLNLYNSGLATLTIGSIMEGVLEIYGTTNNLLYIFWFVGAAMVIIGVLLYSIGLLRGKNNSKY